MSGLFRRFAIFATVEGLLIHGNSDQHKSILIEYGTQRISEQPKHGHSSNEHAARLDVSGLVGLLNVANSLFLIVITRKQEVARIYGKPVYLVTDVAILPLSSQKEASTAILNAIESVEDHPDDSNSSSDCEDGNVHRASSESFATTPADDIKSHPSQNTSSTGVAESVATRNVSFGRFATQWLSRQRWPASQDTPEQQKDDISTPKPASKDDKIIEDVQTAKQETREDDTVADVKTPTSKLTATMGLLPRILKTTKMIITSGSYFFSYDIDLTQRFEHLHRSERPLRLKEMNPMYFWNRNLGISFLESEYSNFLTPILQGFVGQRAFVLRKTQLANTSEATVEEVVDDAEKLKEAWKKGEHEQAFVLTLVSRRSTKRSGLRYLRRGIDDEGYVANFVETEQLLSAADWASDVPIRSFLQIRGSIPVYFSQSPYSFKPAVVLSNSPHSNEKAFAKHFDMLKRQYGAIQIALLVDRHATEKPVGEAFENLYRKAREENKAEDVHFEWFDFHAECRGMKFENVSRLVDKLNPFLESLSETVINDGQVTSRQKGVVRTNCMDCLDRTNVAQSAFGQHKLQQSLEAAGYSIDFVTDASTNWFNTLWADNGDAISRQYASTAALKGDFTRTRKRNWRGAMNDLGLTISRYYSNMVNDYFSQAVIDVVLGNVSWKVFEDFESTMKSADPGVSVQSGREAAIDTCSKMVIQDPEKEDVIHAWTMVVPNQENSLRTLPLEEAVVLLTDSALYCCRMDWSTEKIAKYEKVDLRSIRSIKVGVYITSTFTERQMDEQLNRGLVVYYLPGKEDLVRVNTRSLQNYHVPEDDGRQGVDGGTGILSWVASSVTRTSNIQERMMAFKVVPSNNDEILARESNGVPNQVADSVADEIMRAVSGSTVHGEQRGKEMIKRVDIISVAEAKRRTGYLEQAGHSLKKLVWA